MDFFHNIKILPKQARTFLARHKKGIYIGAISLFCIIIANLFVAQYVLSERAVYYWDISAYWKNGTALLDTFNDSIRTGIGVVSESVSETDYNYLPLLPLLPVMKIFGNSRLVFVLGIFNLYIVPFAIVLCLTLRTILKKLKVQMPILVYPAVLSAALFFPAILIPVFDARVDAICLLIASLIFFLSVKTGYRRIVDFFYLGILCVAIAIMRRYFCFWVVGFLLALFLYFVFSSLKANKYKINKIFFSSLIKPAVGFCVAGVTVLSTMVLFFHPVFERYISIDYSDAYSAYFLGDYLNQFSLLVRHFGTIIIMLSIIGYALVFVRFRHTILSKVSTFLIIQGGVIFALFTRTQTMGVHHLYMIVPTILFPVLLLAIYPFLVRAKRHNVWMSVSVCAIILSLSTYSFIGQRSSSVNIPHQVIFGLTENVRPIVREDTEALKNLEEYLAATMSQQDYVYVVSSSEIFNDDILHNIIFPSTPRFNISGTKHVDKRDGFPNYFFDANYVIVADPVQTHIEKSGQAVITVLAETILSGDCDNLEEINRFELQDGVSLRIFRKNAPYSDEYIMKLKSIFSEMYPDYPMLNDIKRLN